MHTQCIEHRKAPGTFKLTALAAVMQCLSVSLPVAAQMSNQDESENNENDQASVVEVINVTGSRIRRTDLESNTPVVSFDADTIEKTGTVDVNELLNTLPSMTPSGGRETSNFNGYAGISRQDLRGLGATRTLVLVNGRRHVPSVPGTSEVDVSSIPTDLIERIDIMTGGASAIYGADAVSGVVNIILKDNFEGTKVNASYAQTEYDDAQRFYFTLTHGQNFDDGKGNYNFHVNYQKSNEAEANTRDYVANDLTYIMNPDGSSPSRVLANRSPLYASSQRVFLIEGLPYYLDSSGNSVAMTAPGEQVYGTSTTQLAALTVDSDNPNFYTRYNWGRLAVPVEKLGLNFNLNREITDDVTFTSELKYVRTLSESRTEPLAEYGVDQLAMNYPYYSNDQLAEVARTGQGLLFGGYFPELGRQGADYQYDLFQGVFALEGSILDEYRWQVSAQHGQTAVDITSVNDYSQAYWDKEVFGTQGWVWSGTEWLWQASCDEGCSINVFQPLSDSDIAALKIAPHTSKAKLKQTVLSVSIDGDLFELPAGYASFAAGVEHRRETSTNTPSDVQLNGLGANYYSANPLSGKYNVTEAFAEVRLPILSDMAFAESAVVSGAWRTANYSTAGTNHSWMLGLDWNPNDSLKLRASRAKAARAPNINEIYQQESQYWNYVYEVCYSAYRQNGSEFREANCNARGLEDPSNYYSDALIVESGNENLEAERAYTFTAGAVIAPEAIDNLSFTIDYWDINLVDKIGTIDWSSVYPNCMDAPTLDNVFCDMLEFNDDFTQVNVQYLNLASHRTKGVDYALNYQYDLKDYGLSVSFRGNWSRLLQRDLKSDPTSDTVVTLGELAFPKWRGRNTLQLWNDTFSVSLTANYIGSQTPDNTNDPANYSVYETGRLWYLDAGFNYKVGDTTSLNFYVSNLSGRQTPQIPAANTGGASWEQGYTAGLYTTLGRYYTVSLSHSF